MTFFRSLFLSLLLPSLANADLLPGFRLESVAEVEGFVSSVVTDSNGMVYLTTTDGWIHRVDGASAIRVASLPTHSGSNSGLLGMALLDDETAVVHYTAWGENNIVLDDMISLVDLTNGAELVLRAFACDVELHDRGTSPEHHGGNPIVAPDGSIFVGIGEYGHYVIAQDPAWNAGKIWRIDPHGNATQFARGLRNPYDLAWDPELARIVVADNGPQAGDEIHVIAEGSNCGWPKTFGFEPPVEGMVPPDYVFSDTVAPTGLLRLDGANSMLRRGYLLGAFVTSALYYFPSVATPIADPIPIVEDFDNFIIDVTQSRAGDIYVATASFPSSTTIHRLVVPARGDCDGDGLLGGRDIMALHRELDDGSPHRMIDAQEGEHRGSWGCDANADGLIDEGDLVELRRLLNGRRRAVGVR